VSTAPLRPSAVAPVALADVARTLGLQPPQQPGGALMVTGVTHDSTQVRPGDLFVAVPGARVDGAAFAEQAVLAGAVAVLSSAPLLLDVPVLVIPDPRAVMGAVAAQVYGHPGRALRMVGITGTNGKTTTAHLIDAALRSAGHTTALLGTIGVTVAGEALGGRRTTPESTDLQALLAVAVERGVDVVTMEVSSHALALHRVNGCRFAVAVFTNLSQDHLDFHCDMEEYFAVKALLFRPSVSDAAVIDVTDQWGARLAGEVAGIPVQRVGADAPGRTQLLGAFNARNAALAVATLTHLGIPGAEEAVAEVPGIPGRMEQVDEGQGFLALVDYAHTPAAVAALLAAVRCVTTGKVTVVLGCGGDRDRTKRPLMGAAAAAGADRVLLTDDNPRSESSAEILAAMLSGVPAALRDRVVVCPDRAAAIELAVGPSRPGDAVVVAGKGHETGQESGGTWAPFDDRVQLQSALLRRGGQ
jgi:UDP-N-acetylmuramoyl-L-alanyl-D-glutamate--2,6-diaminopimelate ligase